MRKTRTTIPWGELLIPGLAVAYTIATLADQVIRDYEKNTLMYGFMIGGGVMFFAAICIASALRKRVQVKDGPLSEEDRQKRKKITFFLIWTALFIVSLELIGFIITVPAFLFVFFRRLGITEIWKAALISLCAGAIVYILFYSWAGLELPMGIIHTFFA